MFNANKFKIIGIDDENKLCLLDVRQIDITHQGEVVVVSHPIAVLQLEKNGYDENDAYKSAKDNADCQYVCLTYEDAANIVDMLNQVINKLDTNPEVGAWDDIRVFGDKAISYERLVDRLDGLCYPIYMHKHKKE